MRSKIWAILLLLTVAVSPALGGNRVLKNLSYGPAKGTANLLDLYLPGKGGAPAPLIVWIHGGAWVGGDKASVGALWLVNDGYAVASINYRLAPAAHFPAQLDDCKLAIRWLRGHSLQYGIDGAHIGAWGESAGGNLAALVAMAGRSDPSVQVQAVCDWYGPSDLLTLDRAGTTGPIEQLLGGTATAKAELAREASPVLMAGPKLPAFLICHGELDPLVPVVQSLGFSYALRRAGDDAVFVQVHGAGHGGAAFYRPDILRQVHGFFDLHLKAAKGTTRPA